MFGSPFLTWRGIPLVPTDKIGTEGNKTSILLIRTGEVRQGVVGLYATKLLSDVPGLRIIGTAAEKAGVISFVLNGKESEGVGAALNQEGIAVRSGHHCAQPILRRFGLESTVRPSFALYNTYADIDALVAALRRIQSGHNPYMG